MIFKNKGIIEEFNTIIYPLRIVVAIGDVEKEVNNSFKPRDARYNYIAPRVEACEASVYEVEKKKDGGFYDLLWIYRPKDYSTNILAHECGHLALDVFSYIGARVDYENQEPFCYLLGAIAKFVNSTYYKYIDSLSDDREGTAESPTETE